MKYEWRKQEKAYYLPKEPQLIEVPAYQFITLTGEGNPNRPEFSEQISALYMMAYGLRMGLKKGSFGNTPFEYTVYPLEGVWTLPEKPQGPIAKEELIYKIMIRQPEQVTADLAAEQLTQIMKKKENRFWNEFVSKNTKKAGPCKLVTSVLLTQKQKRLRKCKTIAKPTIYQLFPRWAIISIGRSICQIRERQHQKKQKQSYAGG